VPLELSVIVTVYNEGSSIIRLLDSLAAQSRMPDEIVIVDGGSTDNTLEILKNYAARKERTLCVYSRPGTNISQGRNVAIAAAQGDIIAVTDAGVRLDPRWLEELACPFDQDADVNTVAGFFVPDPQTPFEVAMGATVLPAVTDVNPNTFLPSSRSVAFLKTAWASTLHPAHWSTFGRDPTYVPFSYSTIATRAETEKPTSGPSVTQLAISPTSFSCPRLCSWHGSSAHGG
jgi:glycosyltransferase involved in cell wall biosynthesis